MITEAQLKVLRFLERRQSEMYSLAALNVEASVTQTDMDDLVRQGLLRGRNGKWMWSSETARLLLIEYQNQRSELNARAEILDSAVVKAKEQGFEHNSWIGSIEYSSAKIAALEAKNAALRGLMAKALVGLAVFEDVRGYGNTPLNDDKTLYVYDSYEGEIGHISVFGKNKCLHIKHLRAAATIAADIRGALDPTTPYEDTPDGSDYMATACTQCGKSNTECVCGADDDE